MAQADDREVGSGATLKFRRDRHFGSDGHLVNTGKYKIYLDGDPIKLEKPIGLGKNRYLKPQGPKYTKISVLQAAKTLDDIWG